MYTAGSTPYTAVCTEQFGYSFPLPTTVWNSEPRGINNKHLAKEVLLLQACLAPQSVAIDQWTARYRYHIPNQICPQCYALCRTTSPPKKAASAPRPPRLPRPPRPPHEIMPPLATPWHARAAECTLGMLGPATAQSCLALLQEVLMDASSEEEEAGEAEEAAAEEEAEKEPEAAGLPHHVVLPQRRRQSKALRTSKGQSKTSRCTGRGARSSTAAATG